MKTHITYSLLAAAAACGMAFGAETAYTTPVGYATQPLTQGFNAVGLTLQTPTLAAGNFETVSGTALTDSGVTYAPIAGKTYILEITSGVLLGTIQEVLAASISGSTITTPDNLQTAGLVVGDTYRLRVAPTLEEVFGTTSLPTGVLQNGISSTGADVVWLPTAPGAYAKYFLHTSGAFRIAGTSTPSPNVPVVYADGLFVQKKGATAAALTVSGEVKTKGTNSVIGQGFNLVSVVAPVGLTLANAGIENSIQAGISATGADIVSIQQANLTYIKYFRHTSGNWRTVSAPTVNLTAPEVAAITISNGFLVQRKAATAVNLKLNVPTGYSNL